MEAEEVWSRLVLHPSHHNTPVKVQGEWDGKREGVSGGGGRGERVEVKQRGKEGQESCTKGFEQMKMEES